METKVGANAYEFLITHIPSRLIWRIHENDTEHKKVAKCVISRFFHEKWETFKKVPKNGQIGKLLLSVSTTETKSRRIKMVVLNVTMYLADKWVI